MRSKKNSWLQASYEWYTGYVPSNSTDPFSEALNEADTAINKVQSVGDIGSLSLTATRADLNTLEEKRYKYVFFCNGVHEEIGQLVDNPFHIRVNETAEEAYSLDPSDIRVYTGGWLNFETGPFPSLSSLLFQVVTEKKAKTDLQNKIDNLDRDKIENDLAESVKTANFWKREYELTDATAKVAQEVFTPEVRSNWASYTPAERESYLQKYVSKLNALHFGLFSGKYFSTKSVKLQVDPQCSGFGWSSGSGAEIGINPDFVNTGAGQYNLNKAIDTTTHEFRHQYQEQVLSSAKFAGYVPTKVQNEMNQPYVSGATNYMAYYRQPVEYDSKAFGALVGNHYRN